MEEKGLGAQFRERVEAAALDELTDERVKLREEASIAQAILFEDEVGRDPRNVQEAQIEEFARAREEGRRAVQVKSELEQWIVENYPEYGLDLEITEDDRRDYIQAVHELEELQGFSPSDIGTLEHPLAFNSKFIEAQAALDYVKGIQEREEAIGAPISSANELFSKVRNTIGDEDKIDLLDPDKLDAEVQRRHPEFFGDKGAHVETDTIEGEQVARLREAREANSSAQEGRAV